MSKKCADSCIDTTRGIVISARSQRRQESDSVNDDTMTIPQVVPKQLSAHFLLTLVQLYVVFFFRFRFTSTKELLSFLVESDPCRLWLLALMMIPRVVTKQLSAHFLLTFVLRHVDFSDLDSPAQRNYLAL